MAESVENRVHSLRKSIADGKARAKRLFAELPAQAAHSSEHSLENLLGRIRVTGVQYSTADEPQSA